MTKQEIARLSFKIASLYALIQSMETISIIGFYAGALSQGDATNSLLRLSTLVFVSALLAALSWYLWNHAGRLSQALFPVDESKSTGSISPCSGIQEVAYRILGLYALILALSRLSSVVVSVLARSKAYQTNIQIPPDAWGNMATMILQSSLGVWLILGAPKLDEVLRMIRRENKEV